ncbi:hypothetical protein [Inhella sp.]|uniref:hypothetical protein n=1 Tax=Inhella sp. TaxID=1921806 RepID=UPI0035B47424
MTSELPSGIWLLGLAIGLALLWALWTAWSGGWLKRWLGDWSLQASRKFSQPSAQVEPPEVHRAHEVAGDAHKPTSGKPTAPARHRSGQRHS